MTKEMLLKNTEFDFERKENITDKEENTGYQQFLPYSMCSLRVSSRGSFKTQAYMVKLETVFPLWSIIFHHTKIWDILRI